MTTTHYPSLPAFRIHYNNGTSYVTSMAKDVSLNDAKRYFLGQNIEQADEKTILRVVKVEPHFEIGDYAQSIESGWIGRIEAFEEKGDEGDVFCRMIGVDEFAAMFCDSIEEALTPDDTQWFVPADLKHYSTNTRTF